MHWRPLALAAALATLSTGAHAQPATPPAQAQQTAEEKTLLDLSRQKWLWMADRNLEALDKLFDEKAVFVHMSRTLSKSDELGVIKSGKIQYKQADIEESSVRFIGDTAIVLNKIQLFAIVRGNEARNPFMVTEVYVKRAGAWKLGALSFTRLVTP